MNHDAETWRPVVGYEGWYEVSDHGRMSDQRHAIAGRIVGRSGVVTFCYCGLAFFIAYDGEETFESRTAAREGADERWSQHWKQVRPEQWLIAHPQSGPKETS